MSDAEPVTATPPRDTAEIELKFELGPNDLRRLLRHPAFAAAAESQKLASLYYDTPDFDLRQRGLSLRVRTKDEAHIQTLKQVRSGDLFDRDEWEAPVASTAFDGEALAETPLGKLLKKRAGEIGPVFRNRVTREVRLWTVGETVIEIAVDRGEVKAGDRRERISELELELKSGDPHALYELARELFDITPLRLSLTSKGERGYRLASTALAGRTRKALLTPQMTVAQAFAVVARSCLVQIMDATDAFRREPEPECIHQARIGLRRLRTALHVFREAVKDDLYDRLDAELSWLAAELGAARNLDVFIEEVFDPAAEELSDAKGAARYGEHLVRARTAAYDRVKTALDADRFARLSLDLALWIEDGAWKAVPDAYRKAVLTGAIGPFAAQALEHSRAQVREGGEHLATIDPDIRHRLRIRAKRLRYATEFFAEAFGEDGDDKRRRKFTEALKALQATLGDLNDITQANITAHEIIRGGSSTAMAFIAGELVGRVRLKEPRVLSQALEAFDIFDRAKRFWPKPPKVASDEDQSLAKGP